MDTKKSIEWLEKYDLTKFGKQNHFYLEKIFKQCLDVKDENILIIGDTGLEGQNISCVLSYAYYLAAKKLKLNAEMVLQKQRTRGQEAGNGVITGLENLKKKSVIILNVSDKLGSLRQIGKSFRKFCVNNRHRFVSATGLGYLPTEKISEVIDALNIDYTDLRKKQQEIKKKIDKAKKMRITTLTGTDLTIDIKDVNAISADGCYNKPGTGGNLPAGEVYLAPKNVNGVVFIDASSRNRFNTRLIRKPIKMVVENGFVTSIEDGHKAALLKKTLEWAESKAKYPERIRKVAEFGIGVNPFAKVIGTTIVDEKALGTAHIAIGSNYWFGGSNKTIVHLDQVFRNPRIELDGKVLKV